MFESGASVVGFGRNPRLMFEVAAASDTGPLSSGLHIAFTAGSDEAVRRFHAVALARRASDHGAPGLRPDYGPGYFAAYVIDPNGHNLEAVFHLPIGHTPKPARRDQP